MPTYILGLDRLAKYSLVGLLFYVPLTVGAGSFNDVKAIIFAVAVIVSAALLLLMWEEREGKRLLPQGLLPYPMALFLLFSLLFLVKPFALRESVAAILLVFAYFLTYGVISTRLREEREVFVFLWVLLISATLVSLKGINQYLYEFSALSQQIAASGLPINLEGRVFSTFIGPNGLAGFLLLSLPISLSLAQVAKTSGVRLFSWICAGFLLVALLLTFSRASLVITVFLLFLLVVFSPPGKRRGIAVGLLGLAVVALALVGVLYSVRGGSIDFFRPLFTLESSFTSRQGFWETSLRIARAFPVRGSGIGTFASIYPRFQRSGAYSQHAHNSYLEMFAETGLIGGLLFLAIVVLVLYAVVRALRTSQSKDHKYVITALLLGGLGFLLHNLVDFDWYIPATALYFWAFCGLAVALGETGKSQAPQVPSTRPSKLGKARLLLWGLALLLVLLLGRYFMSLSQADSFAENGRAALRAGAWDEAVFNLKKAVERDPMEANYHSLLAQGYAGQSLESGNRNRLLKAIAEMKRAAQLQPAAPHFRGLLGTYYLSVGEARDALREWQKAKELAPLSPVYYNLSGSAYLQLGETAKAIAEFGKAISYARWYQEGETGVPLLKREAQSAPRSIYEAYLRLAAIYLSQGQDGQVLDLYGQAIEFSPREAAAFHARASFFASKGNYEQAVKNYEEVLALEPRDITAHFRLGLIYEQIGQYERAEGEYEEVLRMKPENEEARERLEQLSGN